MTSRVHANRIRTTLSSSITDSDTSMVVASVTGFPSISSGIVYRLTLVSGTDIEIVEVTAASSTTLTITRAQESTTAAAFPSGALVELRVTADSVDRKEDLVSGRTLTTATVDTSDLVLIQDISDSSNLKTVTAQSIADLAAGGSTSMWEFIGSQTASSSATLNFTGIGDYSEIHFVFNRITASGATPIFLYMQTSSNNGASYDNGSGDYCYFYKYLTYTGSTGSAGDNSTATGMLLTQISAISNGSNQEVSGDIKLFCPTAAGHTRIFGHLAYTDSSSNPNIIDIGGVRKSTSGVNAVQFLWAVGNIASGTIYAYGLRKTA